MEIKTQLVIIQSTSFCNINCRYCYLPERSRTNKISLATVARIFTAFFSSTFVGEDITVVWHAGEPLVLPIHFYEEVFHEIQRCNTKGIRVTHSFQTNAMLLTQEWCDFFKRHEVQVGISLDGPQQFHDANRVDRAGKGTFERVMRGVGLLQENAIPFTVIAVVTRDSVRSPEEFWRFFTHIRPARLGLNAEEVEGVNTSSSLEAEEDIEQYKLFFKRILALSALEENPIVVRESESLFRHIKHGALAMRSQTNIPGVVLSFDYAGNVSTFSPELLTMTHPVYKDFTFGNVFDQTLEEMFTSQKFLIMNAEIQRGVRKCKQTCDYFMFCGGGYPSNKLYEKGTFDATETTACRLRIKVSADAMMEHLEERYHLITAGTDITHRD